jgi:hypothetical protein
MSIILLVTAVVLIFEYAAMRWGADTREAYRFRRRSA